MLNKERIKYLLDTAFELEGLLQLANSREEIPAQVETLIREKITLLGDAVATEETVTDHLPVDGTLEQETHVEVSEEKKPEEREHSIEEFEPVEVEEPSFESYDLDDDVDDDADDDADDESEEKLEEEDYPEEDYPEEEVTVVGSAPEPMTIKKEPESSGVDKVRDTKTASAPIFSINDRFLYSRELFGGRIADFEDALKDVASMENYEEAEEYFISELGFNPELPGVQSFLAIIEKCF